MPNPIVSGKIMPKNLYISHMLHEQFIYANTVNQNIICITHCKIQKNTWLCSDIPLCQPTNSVNLAHHSVFKVVIHSCNTSNNSSPILLTVVKFLNKVKYWTTVSLHICIISFRLCSAIFALSRLSYSELTATVVFDACLSPFQISHLYWYCSSGMAGKDLT